MTNKIERNVYVNEFPWGGGYASTMYDPESRIVVEFFPGGVECPRVTKFDPESEVHRRRYLEGAIQTSISEEAYREITDIPKQLSQLQEIYKSMTELVHKEVQLERTLKDQEGTVRGAMLDSCRKIRYRRLGKEMPQE